MIDTDKYEELLENGMQHRDLWELAAELLAEVKRLQDYKSALLHWMMNHLDRVEDEIKEMIYE